jgi:hypothetical protein
MSIESSMSDGDLLNVENKKGKTLDIASKEA